MDVALYGHRLQNVKRILPDLVNWKKYDLGAQLYM